MVRSSSIHRLPPALRNDLERWLVVERLTIDECLGRLAPLGYFLSKSALGRYRKRLFDGAEDLQVMAVGGVPLADCVAAMVAEADSELADMVHEVMTLQIRLFAATRRIRRHIQTRQRDEKARAWVAAQQEDNNG